VAQILRLIIFAIGRRMLPRAVRTYKWWCLPRTSSSARYILPASTRHLGEKVLPLLSRALLCITSLINWATKIRSSYGKHLDTHITTGRRNDSQTKVLHVPSDICCSHCCCCVCI